MNDFNDLIRADGGRWRELEVARNHTIVKVEASEQTLSTIAQTFTRIPVARLDDSLASLSTAQKNVIIAKVQDLGYTLSELQAAFPNDLGSYTLRDLLRFVASRRRRVRYVQATDSFVDDGDELPTGQIESIDF